MKGIVAKPQSVYVCQSCGVSYPKWRGQCEGCSQWNTLSLEHAVPKAKSSGNETIAFQGIQGVEEEVSFARIVTGKGEFDRVCGGGLVGGSVTLVAGDPGIGKSTLLLQVAGIVARQIPTFYISGEESVSQVRLRAQRLGLENTPLQIASTTVLEDFLPTLEKVPLGPLGDAHPRALVILDSIQTVISREVQAPAGSLSQIRECLHHLLGLAKSRNISVLIVGHITKDGMIAGPKTLEHMVDTVLYFEGERTSPYRLLRTRKNRFGATDEIGVFDMTDKGLQEVSNPSALFLSHRNHDIPGACIYAGLEGSRPMLLEIQALSTVSFLTNPRRSVVGWDGNRLSMVLAILEARCGLSFANKDVFLSVLGGLRITEPAADVAVALAILSCLKKRPLPHDAVAFGEMGLTGEIRPVPYTELRLKEAEKLGFTKAFIPYNKHRGQKGDAGTALSLYPIKEVKDLELWFKN